MTPKEKDEQIKKDIIDFYKELMESQEKIRANSLAAGGNVGVIISAYINAKYNNNKCNCNNKNSLY